MSASNWAWSIAYPPCLEGHGSATEDMLSTWAKALVHARTEPRRRQPHLPQRRTELTKKRPELRLSDLPQDEYSFALRTQVSPCYAQICSGRSGGGRQHASRDCRCGNGRVDDGVGA